MKMLFTATFIIRHDVKTVDLTLTSLISDKTPLDLLYFAWIISKRSYFGIYLKQHLLYEVNEHDLPLKMFHTGQKTTKFCL